MCIIARPGQGTQELQVNGSPDHRYDLLVQLGHDLPAPGLVQFDHPSILGDPADTPNHAARLRIA